MCACSVEVRCALPLDMHPACVVFTLVVYGVVSDEEYVPSTSVVSQLQALWGLASWNCAISIADVQLELMASWGALTTVALYHLRASKHKHLLSQAQVVHGHFDASTRAQRVSF